MSGREHSAGSLAESRFLLQRVIERLAELQTDAQADPGVTFHFEHPVKLPDGKFHNVDLKEKDGEREILIETKTRRGRESWQKMFGQELAIFGRVFQENPTAPREFWLTLPRAAASSRPWTKLEDLLERARTSSDGESWGREIDSATLKEWQERLSLDLNEAHAFARMCSLVVIEEDDRIVQSMVRREVVGHIEEGRSLAADLRQLREEQRAVGGFLTLSKLRERWAEQGWITWQPFAIERCLKECREASVKARGEIRDRAGLGPGERHIPRPELSRLLEAIQGTEQGKVLLVGHGGIGKSALLKAAAEKLEKQDWKVLLLPLSGPPNNDHIQPALSEWLRNARHCLMLDGIEELREVGLLSWLHYLAKKKWKGRLVLAARQAGATEQHLLFEGDVAEIRVDPLPASEVEGSLGEGLSPSQHKLYSVPLFLDLALRLQGGQARRARSGRQVLDHFYGNRALERRITAERVANWMDQQVRASVPPRSLSDADRTGLADLERVGILARTGGSDLVSFRHHVHFEYSLCRALENGDENFVHWILSRRGMPYRIGVFHFWWLRQLEGVKSDPRAAQRIVAELADGDSLLLIEASRILASLPSEKQNVSILRIPEQLSETARATFWTNFLSESARQVKAPSDRGWFEEEGLQEIADRAPLTATQAAFAHASACRAADLEPSKIAALARRWWSREEWKDTDWDLYRSRWLELLIELGDPAQPWWRDTLLEAAERLDIAVWQHVLHNKLRVLFDKDAALAAEIFFGSLEHGVDRAYLKSYFPLVVRKDPQEAAHRLVAWIGQAEGKDLYDEWRAKETAREFFEELDNSKASGDLSADKHRSFHQECDRIANPSFARDVVEAARTPRAVHEGTVEIDPSTRQAYLEQKVDWGEREPELEEGIALSMELNRLGDKSDEASNARRLEIATRLWDLGHGRPAVDVAARYWMVKGDPQARRILDALLQDDRANIDWIGVVFRIAVQCGINWWRDHQAEADRAIRLRGEVQEVLKLRAAENEQVARRIDGVSVGIVRWILETSQDLEDFRIQEIFLVPEGPLDQVHASWWLDLASGLAGIDLDASFQIVSWLLNRQLGRDEVVNWFGVRAKLHELIHAILAAAPSLKRSQAQTLESLLDPFARWGLTEAVDLLDRLRATPIFPD